MPNLFMANGMLTKFCQRYRNNRTDGDELINAAILKLDEKVLEYEYTEEESGMV